MQPTYQTDQYGRPVLDQYGRMIPIQPQPSAPFGAGYAAPQHQPPMPQQPQPQPQYPWMQQQQQPQLPRQSMGNIPPMSPQYSQQPNAAPGYPQQPQQPPYGYPQQPPMRAPIPGSGLPPGVNPGQNPMAAANEKKVMPSVKKKRVLYALIIMLALTGVATIISGIYFYINYGMK